MCRLRTDVLIQAGIARFFARKLQAAVAYALYEKTGDSALLREVSDHYNRAYNAWVELGCAATLVYAEDITFGKSAHLRGCWADRLPAIQQERTYLAGQFKAQVPRGRQAEPSRFASLLTDDCSPVARPRCLHLPPDSCRPGTPIPIEIAAEDGYELTDVRLHYRHVNQADEYQVAEMVPQAGRFCAEIPGRYTDSPYPLMYYFELHDGRGRAWLYPGLDANLANQPYFVVRHGR